MGRAIVTIILGGSALAALIGGCSDQGGSDSPHEPDAASHHAHSAPHGGALVVLGEEFAHLELVFDPSSGTVEAYILDGEVERGIPISAGLLRFAVDGIETPLELEPHASALSGEDVGHTSTFNGRWPELDGWSEFSATLEEITVRGSTFRRVAFRFPEGNEVHGEDEHD